MTKMVSFLVLVGIIIAIGFLFYRVMITFLLPLFLAALLVIMFRPLHRWFLVKCKGRPQVAAGLTTATVMLIVLAPAVVIISSAAIEASSLIVRLNDSEIKQKLSGLREYWELELPYAEELRFFETTFETLVEQASAGATARIDKQVLGDLEQSLAGFQAQVENTSPPPPQLAATVELVRTAAVQPTGSVEMQTNIYQAARQFRRFKIELLGGEYRARLKELANPTAEELERIRNWAFAGAPDWFRIVGGATGAIAVKLLVGIVIMVIALYFFLCDGPAMVSSLMRLSPLDDRHEQELLDEFDRVSRAVVVATLLSAVVQGVLAGFGFWFADVGTVFFLAVLTTIFALIPFVGAAAIWVPVSLYLFFFEERYLAAIVLAIYGGAIVSMADNLIKPWVLHGQSNLHPLLALLSVLGGVQALGPIGVLVGPMVVVFLQTLLNILHRELVALERRAAAASD